MLEKLPISDRHSNGCLNRVQLTLPDAEWSWSSRGVVYHQGARIGAALLCFETHEDVFLSCKQHATEVIFGFLEIKYTSASNMAIDCVRFCVVLFDNENGYTKDRKVFHVYGKCKILLTIVRYTCIFSKIDLYVDSCLVDLVHLHIGSMMLSLSCLLTLVQICLRTVIGTGCIYIYIYHPF